MHKYSILLLFVFASLTVFSQSPTIVINGYGQVCLNRIYKIPVTVTGQFAVNNRFYAQLRPEYSTETFDIPVTPQDSNMEIMLKDTALLKNRSVSIRIISTSPRVESPWISSYTLHTRGNISISAAVDTINLYDELITQLRGFSDSPVNITLSDSTFFSFSQTLTDSQITAQLRLFPEKSTTYKITTATNACGAMTVTGKVDAGINPISIRTTFVGPVSLCPGSDLKVNASITGGTLPENIQYKIRITQLDSKGETIPNPKYYDLPATAADNQLTAQIPENFTVESRTFFSARVIVENPFILGDPGKLSFTITPKPRVELTADETTVGFGNATRIKIKYAGPSPFAIHFNDGSQFHGSYVFDKSIDFETQRNPAKTFDYAVQSVESGCGLHTISNQIPLRITVNPGFILDGIKPERIYCEGDSVRLHFITNTTLTPSSDYTMLVSHIIGQQYKVKAKRDGDFVTFKIPAFQDDKNLSRRANFSFQLISETQAIISAPVKSITVQSKPAIFWNESNETTFKLPSNPSTFFTPTGGAPYIVELQDGKIKTYPYEDFGSTEFFVLKSGEYGLKSISNACFNNPAPAKINFKIEDETSSTPIISVFPESTVHCYSDIIELDIQSSGQFNAGNKFNIESNGGLGCCEFKAIATHTGNGKVKFRIPADSNPFREEEYTIRVTSTDPVAYSKNIILELAYPVTDLGLRFTQSATMQDLFTSNYPIFGLAECNGGPAYSLIISDGKKDSTVNFFAENNSVSFPVNPQSGENHYTIKSVTSACGTMQVNISKELVVMPYRIDFPVSYENPYVCAGSTFYVPFFIVDGKKTNATFFLQISKDESKDYINLASSPTSTGIRVQIPETLSEGQYFFRIASSDGAFSSAKVFRVAVAPTGTLTVIDKPDADIIQMEPGEGMDLKVSLTGTLPIRTVTDGIWPDEHYVHEVGYYILAERNREYKLRAVTNLCGYGTVSGSVRVNVAPKLTASVLSESYCQGQKATVQYKLQGEFDLTHDYIYFDLININTRQRLALDSSKTAISTKEFLLSGAIKPGEYFLRVMVPKYNLEYEYRIEVQGKPDVILTGNTTINAGEQTNIVVKSKVYSGFKSFSYTLSDGSSGMYFHDGEQSLIKVFPSKTTTYTISSISNECGTGVSFGSATVTVNAPSEREVAVTGWGDNRFTTTACAGDSIKVYFMKKGSFSAENKFTVQISDTTGTNFKNLNTVGTTSPLVVHLPSDFKRGSGYRFRIITSDAGTASSSSSNPLVLRIRATARFNTDIVYYNDQTDPNVTVLLTGDGPWSYMYGTDLKSTFRTSYFASDTLLLAIPSPSVEYRLLNVSNVCGPGMLGTPSTVKVDLITATEKPVSPSNIIVFPNPSSDFLTVLTDNSSSKKINLYNSAGTLVQKKNSSKALETVDIRLLPTGTYILKIQFEKRVTVFRVVKL